MTLQLRERIKECSDVESFLFQPAEQFNFTPGQYLRYSLPHNEPDNRGINRYFSISSAPEENTIRLTTRFAEKSSSFKLALRNLEIGTFINASGPYGDFTYTNFNQPAVFIAGGIGITPFRSIITHLLETKTPAPILLFYANRDESIVFKDQINRYQEISSEFMPYYIVDNPSSGWSGLRGRIDKTMLTSYIPDLTSRVFYLSGPKPMVESFKNLLQEMGVSSEAIKLDFFPGYTE